MDQYVDKFLSTLASEKGYSDNTIAAYRNDMAQFLTFLQARQGGPVELPSFNTPLVEAYVNELQGGSRHYATSTIARKIAAVKTFCAYLVDQHLIETNPAQLLSSPKVKKHIPKTLTRAELERLLAAPAKAGGAKGARDRALLGLLISTGMRVTEAVNLQVDDIDWDKGVVTCRGKGQRARQLPLGQARAGLADYVQRARAELTRDKSPATLFLNHRGQQLTRQGVWLILKDAAQAAGIGADVTPHTLRHSYARYLVGAGEDLRRVQELLGHANLSTTQIYKQAGADH